MRLQSAPHRDSGEITLAVPYSSALVLACMHVRAKGHMSGGGVWGNRCVYLTCKHEGANDRRNIKIERLYARNSCMKQSGVCIGIHAVGIWCCNESRDSRREDMEKLSFTCGSLRTSCMEARAVTAALPAKVE